MRYLPAVTWVQMGGMHRSGISGCILPFLHVTTSASVLEKECSTVPTGLPPAIPVYVLLFYCTTISVFTILHLLRCLGHTIQVGIDFLLFWSRRWVGYHSFLGGGSGSACILPRAVPIGHFLEHLPLPPLDFRSFMAVLGLPAVTRLFCSDCSTVLHSGRRSPAWEDSTWVAVFLAD